MCHVRHLPSVLPSMHTGVTACGTRLPHSSPTQVELQPQWSWSQSVALGWLPPNISELPYGIYNVCRPSAMQHGRSPVEHDQGAKSASNDLPWYNVLPNAHSSSPLVLLMG